MKLLYKHDNEVIDVIFEDCDGNLRVTNKNDVSKKGEYGSIRALLKDFKDAPEFGGNPKYERQYRYAKSEKGKAKRREARRRYYLEHKGQKHD